MNLMKILTAVFIFEIVFADNQACPIEMYVFLTNVNEPVTISIIPLSTVWENIIEKKECTRNRWQPIRKWWNSNPWMPQLTREWVLPIGR